MEASERDIGNPHEPYPEAHVYKGSQEHQEATWSRLLCGTFHPGMDEMLSLVSRERGSSLISVNGYWLE